MGKLYMNIGVSIGVYASIGIGIYTDIDTDLEIEP
jgi:hypothetical protein